MSHRLTSPRRLLPAAVVLLATVLLLPPPAPAQICPLPPFIQPTGPFQRPTEDFPTREHMFLHSDTHLQGLASDTKLAAGLIYDMPAVTGFDDFTSGIVIDNPDPTNFTRVRITYRDELGATVGVPQIVRIEPEGFYVEAAADIGLGANGVGSALLEVVEGPDIVGADLLHTPCIFGTICDTELPLSQNQRSPGASSMQQMQVEQGADELWWGPVQLSTIGAIDFYNGQAPFLWVVNPNSVAAGVTVNLVIFDRTSGAVITAPWRFAVLNPGGTLLEKSGPHLGTLVFNQVLVPGIPATVGLWDQFIVWYTQLTNPDFDILINVTAVDAAGQPLPIVGDGVMTDFFGDSTASPTSDPVDAQQQLIVEPPNCQNNCNLQVAKKFRMASTMLAPTPTNWLVNPDFSYDLQDDGAGIVFTHMVVGNAGTTNAGPVTFEVFDDTGGLVVAFTQANLPPGQSIRYDPSHPSYPAVPVGIGSVRVRGCNGDQLVGYSARNIQRVTNHPVYRFPNENHYQKVLGELLSGNGGVEPGNGIVLANATRKISPIIRVGADFPGYTELLNDSVSNIGAYSYNFWQSIGTPGGFCGTAAFDGLPYLHTSWSYEDPEVFAICVGLLSGRVDWTTGLIEGIDVLGDPFDEYGIPGFADGSPGQ